MVILRDRTIDPANIKPSDLIVTNVQGSTLSVQVDAGATVTFKGQHSNFESEEYYPLALINVTTFDKVNTASEAGMYMAMLDGIDTMKIEVSGAGKVHWKELGD